MPAVRHWLLKTEPGDYSFAQLLKDKRTNWDEVRNYQARNFLKEMKKGDLALIYHSGEEKCVVGLARVIREAYPDTPDWAQVDVEVAEAVQRPVPLSEIKKDPRLAGMLLIKNSRLSVMPLDPAHFVTLRKLGGLS